MTTELIFQEQQQQQQQLSLVEIEEYEQIVASVKKGLSEYDRKFRRRERKKRIASKKKTLKRARPKRNKHRDITDIFARILEVVSHQNSIAVTDTINKIKNTGSRPKFSESWGNDHGVMSVHFLQKVIRIDSHLMARYIPVLLHYGLMVIEYIKFRHGSIKKIPLITEKGRQFLGVYKEVRGMLLD